MPQGTQGGCILHLWRLHFCKMMAFVIVMILFLQYATLSFIYKKDLSKVMSPGFIWISETLQQKLGISETKVTNSTSSQQDSAFNSSSQHFAHLLNNSSFSNETYPLEKRNFTEGAFTSSSPVLSQCPLVPPNLVGRLKVLTDAPTFKELEKMFNFLKPGGRYKPSECIARYKVAIIVPYRDREEHLRIFLHNMHPILKRQQLDYGIYIIEESGNTKFNRAMLMNIGYVEALKQYDYDCFIFHDVDLIPEDDRNLYTCPEQPRHMSVAVSTMKYRLPYKDIFGGVCALTKKHMEKLNGFSNEFWGWGGEDDDMANRIKFHGLKISRYSSNIARYTMLKHNKDKPNPERYKKLYKGKARFKTDGLSNLKYNRRDLVLKKLYTWVLVEITVLT